MRDALTELHAYVLVLDGERQRIEDQLAELHCRRAPVHKLRTLRRRRGEIAAQLALLDRTIRALRMTADPTARYL
jgi:hypothetical protein